ncbi:MAG: hypothetical protein WC293_06235 [Candidatus Omnitrophota bacterium]|jgi:hypothetical protein
MKIQIDKKRYYEMQELRTGIPVHAAQRFLFQYCKEGLPWMNRASIIHIIMKHAFLTGGNDKYGKWLKIFEISYNILYASDKKNTKEFTRILDIISEELLHFESNLHIVYEKTQHIISEKIPIREKYMVIMNYYRNLYEGSYKCISSVFAISKKILNDKEIPKDIQVYTHLDPAIKIKEFETDDQGGCVLPIPELYEGCNNHLRNGISHEHWDLKGDTIEIYDISPKENKEIWRKKYTLETIKDEADNLLDTIEAMMLAFILYILSKHKGASGILSVAPGNYDFEYIEDVMQNAAFDFGLFLNDSEVDVVNNKLKIVLCIPNNLDTEQVHDIIEGGNRPAYYKKPVCIVENSVRDMILNFLIVVAGPLQSYSSVTIIVSDEKKGKIGDFEISASELIDFSKGKSGHVEQIFDVLQPHLVKVTKEGPSFPDPPWNPVNKAELLSNWKNLCNSK